MISSIKTVPDLDQTQEVALVKRVIDGDTVELDDGRKIRYIGIDTPELLDPRKPVECFAVQAQTANQELVEGKSIRLEKDISEVDRYDRLLRYVYVGNIFVNNHLIRQGFAHASTFPPDIKHSEQFKEAEREARENNRGLWSECQKDMINEPTLTNFSNSPISSPKPTGTCIIKGNISSGGERIYHLPGCGSYVKTTIDESKGERWFCNEAEAQSAGWRKAKNC